MKIYLIILLFYLLPAIINWLIFHFTYRNDNHNSPGTFEVVSTFAPMLNVLTLIVLFGGGCITVIDEYVIAPIREKWNWRVIIRRIFLLGDQDEE